MEKWIKDRLSICLDFEVPDDMIKYIMSMKSSEELNEYLSDLLNPEYEEHRIFMVDCKQRMFSKAIPNKKSNNQSQLPKSQQNAKKPDKSAVSGDGGGGKKKTKYTNLFTEDGKIPNAILLKGRRPCECEATEHKLVNNCLSCGRIVCEQEGSGPCLFCGDLVCTNEEIQLIRTSKKGDNLKRSLEEKGGGESLRKALEQRDRLLEYDRNSEKRTEVIDDENDYFQDNSTWLSEEERNKLQSIQQELHDMKHANRSSRKYKMDIFGREIEEDAIPEGHEEKVRKEINETLSKTHNWSSGKSHQTDDDSYDTRGDLPKPAFVNIGVQSKNVECIGELAIRPDGRVQDKELLEMTDLRQCLSMHQPYASLLVEGIKKHEGRVWYSSHRGRLWIASTVKEPKREEINEVENFYRKYYNDDSIKFPSQYQTGCLLGCVTVNDIFTQEEYRKRFPNGESESPYVFICSDPQTLPVVFPIKGSHKLYQIEPKIHKAASLAIMKKKT